MVEQVEYLVQKALGKQDKASVAYDSSSSESATEVNYKDFYRRLRCRISNYEQRTKKPFQYKS